jgi:hypothetical protein
MGFFSKIKKFFCDLLGIKTKEEKKEKKDSSPEKETKEPASEEAKDAKEREWSDLEEDYKFVCHGGKVQCQFCAPPIADIIVTSSTIMIQDKPWASVKDKDGIVNFNFTGVCTHPSQQKPSAPPPPCKAVISLGEWKDYSDTMVGDNNALLVKSTIPCNISGQDLKIIHSGQMSTPTEIEPKVKPKPQIIESYWINEDGERIEKIAPNKKASLVIKTKDYRLGEELTVKLKKKNGNEFDSGEKEIELKARVNKEGLAIVKNAYTYDASHLKKKPKIIEAYWRNENGEKISEMCDDEKAELFIRTEGYEPGSILEIMLDEDSNAEMRKEVKKEIRVNNEGIAIIKYIKNRV